MSRLANTWPLKRHVKEKQGKCESQPSWQLITFLFVVCYYEFMAARILTTRTCMTLSIPSKSGRTHVKSANTGKGTFSDPTVSLAQNWGISNSLS